MIKLSPQNLLDNNKRQAFFWPNSISHLLIVHALFSTYVQVNWVWGLDWWSPIQTAPEMLLSFRYSRKYSAESSEHKQMEIGWDWIYEYSHLWLGVHRSFDRSPLPPPSSWRAPCVDRPWASQENWTSSHCPACSAPGPGPEIEKLNSRRFEVTFIGLRTLSNLLTCDIRARINKLKIKFLNPIVKIWNKRKFRTLSSLIKSKIYELYCLFFC